MDVLSRSLKRIERNDNNFDRAVNAHAIFSSFIDQQQWRSQRALFQGIQTHPNLTLMPHSPESLLQLLQRFLAHRAKVQQIHAIIITNNHLRCTSQWKNTLLFNTLIRAHLGFPQNNSFFLFTQMLAHQAQPNAHTFASLLKTLAHAPTARGPPVHAQALTRGVLADPFVRTSLVRLYAEQGELHHAREVFDEMPEKCVVACNAMIDALFRNGNVQSALGLVQGVKERDVVTWTTIVNGLWSNALYKEAVRAFKTMVQSSVKPNEATYVGILGSCAALTGQRGLVLGKELHCHVIRTEPCVTPFVGTALIDLYGKNGLTRAASNMFDEMPLRKICAWNAMISAFGSNGEERKALELFDGLTLKPNELTFVAVLSACARGKLVELGLELFTGIMPRFGVIPVMEHYGCIVDMLGRAGLVREAVEFVERMPIKPDASVLGALLGACKIHGFAELGHEVGFELIDLQRNHSGRYVVLSNINASAQRWDRAEGLRKMMVDAGVEKIPAYSLIA